MKFDHLMELIGEYGPYQKKVLFYLYLDSIMDAFHAGITVFILPILDFRCSLKDFDNDTFQIQGWNHEFLINQTIPIESKDGRLIYDSCKRFANSNDTKSFLEKCDSWVFDKSIYKSTMIEEFSIVCDQKMMHSHIVTSYFLGILVGASLMGIVSDWIGRKKIIISCVLLQGIAGIVSISSQNSIQFIIYRFIIGFGSSGSFVAAFVLCAELVGAKKRALTCFVTQTFFSLGFCLLTGFSYFVKDWRLLMILLSAPSVLLGISLIWLVPESPRFLFTKNENQKAFQIVKEIAAKNGRELPENLDQEKMIVIQSESYGIWKVVTSKTLAAQNFIMSLNWVSVSLCYYALAVNSASLSSDIYLDFFLGALIEFPAYLGTIYLLDKKFKRKTLFAGTMVLAGIACISSTFPYIFAGPDLQWITLLFCLLGRFTVTSGFGTIYLYVCELYPTIARNGALGVFSTFNKMGSITAPYLMAVGDLVNGRFGKGLPFILLALVTLFSGPLVMLLPETSGKPVPDTIKEVKQIKSQSKTVEAI